MDAFDNHYRLPEVMKKKGISKHQVVNFSYEDLLPLAVWADGYFITPARKREEDGRAERLGKSRLCHGKWLYLDPSRLPKFLSQENVGMGFFRSDPDTEVDTWAELKNSEKIRVSMDDLWVPVDSVNKLETSESARATERDNTDRKKAKEKKKKEIQELQQAAVNAAVRLKKLGIADRHITADRICVELEKERFSDDRLFTSRWRTKSGMRSYLKGENNPKSSPKFRDAKSSSGTFNS